MTDQSFKNKAFHGMIWYSIETFVLYGGQFIIGIVLARILTPKDYGLIGMLDIFMAISKTFIDSGLSNALIQRKNRTETDYSTVFVFNLIISIIFYFFLFLSAPLIAGFYDMPQLTLLTRILCINIVINSFAIIQGTKYTIKLDFKTQAKVSSITVIISGMVGITLAYLGFGVWALVFQTLSRSIVSVILLWYLSDWKPSLIFSKSSFNNLFRFGSKLLGASLLSTTFNNIYKIIIGKAYSAKELGFYTQATNIANIASETISNIIQKVTFPILTEMQDDKQRLVTVYKKLIGMTVFFVFPIMTLLSLLAKPFVLLFLTEKWASTIILLQIMCFSRIIRPISTLNMNILKAVGRSDLFLKVDMSKIPLTIVALIITVPLGLKAIVIGHLITSLIAYFINAYLPGKYFGYGAFSQIKDMAKVLLSVSFMAITVYTSSLFLETNALKLFLGGIIGIVAYIGAASILKINETKEVIYFIKTLYSKK